MGKATIFVANVASINMRGLYDVSQMWINSHFETFRHMSTHCPHMSLSVCPYFCYHQVITTLLVLICPSLSLSVPPSVLTKSLQPSLSVRLCRCLSLFVVFCPSLSLSVPLCRCLSLFGVVYPSLSLYVPLCHCLPLVL